MSTAKNEHVGTVGDRLQLLATVVYVKVFRNKWNYTYLAIVRDDQGHSLKTMYSGRKWLPMKGQRIDITATIKKHSDYQGTATTELDHAIVKDLGTAPGFEHCTPAPLPRSEELHFAKQIKAHHAFHMAAMKGDPRAR